MLELFHHGTSVCSSKVRFALAEKGLDYESRIVDLGKGEQHAAEYRKLNPRAVVPTLRHDGHVIVESNVICEYLDDAFSQPPLRPASPHERAHMRLWTKQLDEDVHDCTSVISFALAFRHLQLRLPQDAREAQIAKIPDPVKRDRTRAIIDRGIDSGHVGIAARRFDRLLGDMQSTLADRAWLTGDTFSLADIALAPYVTRLDHLRLWFLWETRPAVARWYRAIRDRAAYRSSHTDWFTHDPTVVLMGEKGAESADRIRALIAD